MASNKQLLLACLASAGAAALVTRWLSSKEEKQIPHGRNVPGLPVDSKSVLKAGNVAVVTGAGSGIGRAMVKKLAARGMKIVIADIDEASMARTKQECVEAGADAKNVLIVRTDVSNYEEVVTLQKKTWTAFGGCHFLMNNAAIQNSSKCSSFAHLDRWHQVLNVNLMGVLHGVQAFTTPMMELDTPCAIVNTGSKQGITSPPGDTAYNVSKAAVKMLTENLQHTLRSTDNCQVNAFLLIPGWTITMISTAGKKRTQGAAFDQASAEDEESYQGCADPEVARQKLQARGAWTAGQVADECIASVSKGAPFYTVCEDNETSTAMDNGRCQWAADDIIFRRVPLSRWSQQYAAEYKAVSKRF